MKATELRIGNRVYDMDKSHIIKIKDGDDIDFAKEYDPISLSEYWFESFGFEKTILKTGIDDIDQWGLDGYCFIEDNNNKWFLYNYNWKTSHFEHVHQLQNLYFALTGEELELKEIEKA